MTSFICEMDNDLITLPIYFTSYMRIVWQDMGIISSASLFYMTVVHIHINMFDLPFFTYLHRK
jgi:hypothetical protein